MILKVNFQSPQKNIIQKAAEIIKKGGVTVFPTDTVYGLLADARNEKAIYKIFKIKKRLKTKPLGIFVKNMEMAKKYAFIDTKQEKFLKKNWPGKITAILKSKNNLPKGLAAGSRTIGIRISDCELIDSLFEKINFPLAQTSANISGKEATTKINEVLEQFTGEKTKPDLIINAGDLFKNKPSKIVDLTKGKPLTIRF